ncbi:MAG: FecR domain-containing protein [Elusimicrobia bacterium]|nr:FecR domain-containing protein [Elusimicrobiota bacterium]
MKREIKIKSIGSVAGLALGLVGLVGLFSEILAAQGAQLQVVQGKVQILRSGENSWSLAPIETTTALTPGDRVRTSNKARALILVDDGSRIEVGPSSVFLVDFLEEKSFRFKLNLGRLKALVSKIRQRNFSIVTPTAVCAVRGTEFEMSFNETSQETAVTVTEGLVAVSDLKGNEVLLNPGESVAVNIDGIQSAPAGTGEQSSATGADDKIKEEVKREVGLNMGREAIEAAAAIEMKDSLAQDGKIVIDAFGKRVRTESYITRNDAENKISWVVLNTRDENFNYGRFDVWAKNSLPQELSSDFLGTLYFHPGNTDSKPSNWALKDQWFMSNTNDYWIRGHAGGNPVFFSHPVTECSPNNGCATYVRRWWETIFDNSYMAVSNAGQTLLLEHFVPADGVKTLMTGDYYQCSAGGGASCLDPNSPAYGNSPEFFYKYYAEGAVIGDEGEQNQTIAGGLNVDSLNTAYSGREGYFNNWRLYLDGNLVNATDPAEMASAPPFSGLDFNKIKLHETIQNRYGTVSVADIESDADLASGHDFAAATLAGGAPVVLTQDNYLINDSGEILSFGKIAAAFANSDSAQDAFRKFADQTNFEFVNNSPTFASKLDLVIPMRILNALDAKDDRPAS